MGSLDDETREAAFKKPSNTEGINKTLLNDISSPANDRGEKDDSNETMHMFNSKPAETVPDIEDWDKLMENEKDFYGHMDSHYNIIRQYSTIYAQMSGQEKRMVGHNMSDMLLRCSWNGYPCSPR